nr:LON peptidase substrate-binding domain-containing protein [Anaerolineae bacterium]
MFNMLDDLQHSIDNRDIVVDELPILPLRGIVAYPFVILPLSIGVPRSVDLVKWAVEEGSLIGLVTSKEPKLEEPNPDQLHQVGIVAKIHRVVRSDASNKGTLQIIVQGLERIKINEWTQTDPFLKAKVTLATDLVPEDKEVEIEALRRRMIELSQAIVEYLPQIPNEVTQFLDQVEDPRIIVYTIASNLRMSTDDQIQVLSEDHLPDKMAHLIRLMSRELEVLEIGQHIRSETQEELDKTQREYYLRQQLRAIQKELGEDDDEQIIREYEEKIEN